MVDSIAMNPLQSLRDYAEFVYTLRQQFSMLKAQVRQGALPGVGFSADFGFYSFLSELVLSLSKYSL
jgi:hypothetical protein